MDAREAFAQLIRRPDGEIPLAEGALWIAAAFNRDLDVARALATLDDLGARVEDQVAPASSEVERVARLNHVLFVGEGFRGNRQDYEDPRNSFLDVVLERRLGIPITLALVYVEVARRLGLDAVGIGFPGHFLARVDTRGGAILVDAFEGRQVSVADCAARIRELSNGRVRFEPSFLDVATHRAILKRILANLKHVYVARGEHEAALTCVDRILMIEPDDPIERRDRGLLHHELDCFRAALDDLRFYLEHAGPDPALPRIHRLVADLERRVQRLH